MHRRLIIISWEHLILLIENGVRESVNLPLASLWGFCSSYAHEVLCADMKRSLIKKFNSAMLNLTGLSERAFSTRLNAQIAAIIERSDREKCFWEAEMRKIEQYSREEAIRELIKAKKIYEKIAQIDTSVRGLQVQ